MEHTFVPLDYGSRVLMVLCFLSPWITSLADGQWGHVENIQSNHVPPFSRTFHSLPLSLRPQKPCGWASSPQLSASSRAAPGTR